MTLTIRSKLFLNLLAAAAVAVLGMHLFMRWSFQQGLLELAETRQEQRLEQIADRLTDRYRTDEGWQRLRSDKRLWVATLLGRGEHLASRTGRWRADRDAWTGDPPLPDEHRRPRHRPPWLRRELGPPGVWPPEHIIDHLTRQHGDRLPLELRIMLLDADASIIYARKDLLDGTRRIPLELDDATIGWIALIAGPSLTEIGELRFRERHTSTLLLIAAAMILLSAGFAFPLAKRLSRPLHEFQLGTRRLSSGDYSTRVSTSSNDELGRLGRDLNHLAQTLESNEQVRRRWIADISHELRTPLALLRAELEAMQDGVRPIGKTAVDALHEDTLRLSRVVDDLYELSMTDLGALSYRMTETDPAEVLSADIAVFAGRFSTANLTLDLEDRLSEPMIIQADEHRLSQLFRNLLKNSLWYTDPGGRLRVRLTRDDDRLHIDFEDTAPGVPADALPRLFERLYRVEGSRSRDTGGAGLGLAIAKNIVEAHDGTIEARPSALGGLWIHIEL